ncbi:MAG: cold shock domain-containing protein [Cyclobacteriaceae bacterium]|nr:cold shock domain-containing protein [Cyclobacteriaceae bacterium SS2]
MGRSRSTFSKRENEKKKQKRKEDKLQKREEKKNSESKSLDDMIAYVDEFGNISDTPPDPEKKKKEIKATNIEVSIPKQEKEDEDSAKQGTVTYYDVNKNFGFIAQDETQDRFFFHDSNVIEPVQEGDKVTFVAKKGLKGMDAVEVKLIS